MPRPENLHYSTNKTLLMIYIKDLGSLYSRVYTVGFIQKGLYSRVYIVGFRLFKQ